jgi:hypothetical protein
MCLAVDASHVIDNPAEHRFLQRGEKAMQPAEQVLRSNCPGADVAAKRASVLPSDNSAKTRRPGLIGSAEPHDEQMARISGPAIQQ